MSQDKLAKNMVKEDDANDSLTTIKASGTPNSDGIIKTSNKLIVFQESQIKAVQAEDKDVPLTPEGLKKVSLSHTDFILSISGQLFYRHHFSGLGQTT